LTAVSCEKILGLACKARPKKEKVLEAHEWIITAERSVGKRLQE